jgi:hypothetical protein
MDIGEIERVIEVEPLHVLAEVPARRPELEPVPQRVAR